VNVDTPIWKDADAKVLRMVALNWGMWLNSNCFFKFAKWLNCHSDFPFTGMVHQERLRQVRYATRIDQCELILKLSAAVYVVSSFAFRFVIIIPFDTDLFCSRSAPVVARSRQLDRLLASRCGNTLCYLQSPILPVVVYCSWVPSPFLLVTNFTCSCYTPTCSESSFLLEKRIICSLIAVLALRRLSCWNAIIHVLLQSTCLLFSYELPICFFAHAVLLAF